LQKVIFDSSFLIAVVEEPTTWYEDILERIGKFEPVLLDCVRDELRRLAAAQDKRARAARVSLDLASKFTRVSCGSAVVDDEIVSVALSKGALVATTDSELARSLKAAHVRSVTLRAGRVSVS
jgi:rRNA-processing protein FCF1